MPTKMTRKQRATARIQGLMGGFVFTLLGLEVVGRRQLWRPHEQIYVDFGPYHAYFGAALMVFGIAFALVPWRNIQLEEDAEKASRS